MTNLGNGIKRIRTLLVALHKLKCGLDCAHRTVHIPFASFKLQLVFTKWNGSS